VHYYEAIDKWGNKQLVGLCGKGAVKNADGTRAIYLGYFEEKPEWSPDNSHSPKKRGRPKGRSQDNT
jgi:hypothetical protein